jgi:tetratricopeptide (TPR) repeat protein
MRTHARRSHFRAAGAPGYHVVRMMAVALLAVAMAVRLVHVWAIRDTPLFDTLMGDARAYDAWAQRIAAGDWMGDDVFYQAPLYPYFLGTLYALAGRDLLIVRLVQAAVGAAAAVLLGAAGERLFSRRVGLLAGFGLALYAPAIFFDSLLQKSVLDVFFICLSIWCVSRLVDRPRRVAWWLGLGLALGALSLTRENALALVLVAVVWAVSQRNHEDHEGNHEEHEEQHTGRSRSAASGRKDRRRARAGFSRHSDQTPQSRRGLRGLLRALRGFFSLGALLLGLGLVLLPVVARNFAVTGGIYLTTAQFGPNFYIGNNPASDGTYMSLRPGRGAPEFERQDATELAEQALRRTLTPAEVSSYWTGRALTFIAERPGDWLALMARKAALLWNAGEMLDTESQETYEDHSPLLRVLAIVGHFGVIVPLALVGLVTAWPDRRRLWPLLAMFAAYAASVVVFYVFARYRFPLVPFLLLFAALGAVSARELFTAATMRQRALLAGAVALVAVAVNWPMLSPTRMRAITETNLGSVFHEAGRYDEAITHYEKAAALEPDYAPAYNNLGVTLRAQGRVDAAIAAYEKGLSLKDDYPDLHYNLANALLEQNRADEAAAHLRQSLAGEPASAATHNNLGMALAAKGQYEEAAAEFRAAIALEPGSVLAHRNLGNVLASMGRSPEALAALERAVALDPKDAQAAYDLGSLLLETGRFPEAATRFEAALAVNPKSVETLNNLGIALASQGRIREAAALFERALAIQPDFADAQRNLATAREAMRVQR